MIKTALRYDNVVQYGLMYTYLFPQLHSNSDKGDGSVRYLLSGEGAGTVFTINEVTGDIHATKSLDREKKSHYVLHARAIDRFTNRAVEPESEFIIKVQDVNDNAPTFPDGPFTASVAELSDIGETVSVWVRVMGPEPLQWGGQHGWQMYAQEHAFQPEFCNIVWFNDTFLFKTG